MSSKHLIFYVFHHNLVVGSTDSQFGENLNSVHVALGKLVAVLHISCLFMIRYMILASSAMTLKQSSF